MSVCNKVPWLLLIAILLVAVAFGGSAAGSIGSPDDAKTFCGGNIEIHLRKFCNPKVVATKEGNKPEWWTCAKN